MLCVGLLLSSVDKASKFFGYWFGLCAESEAIRHFLVGLFSTSRRPSANCVTALSSCHSDVALMHVMAGLVHGGQCSVCGRRVHQRCSAHCPLPSSLPICDAPTLSIAASHGALSIHATHGQKPVQLSPLRPLHPITVNAWLLSGCGVQWRLGVIVSPVVAVTTLQSNPASGNTATRTLSSPRHVQAQWPRLLTRVKDSSVVSAACDMQRADACNGHHAGTAGTRTRSGSLTTAD